MKKFYIVITTVLEKEKIDSFSFIVVKKIILQLLRRRISLYQWHTINRDNTLNPV